MFCPNCGTKNIENALFCCNCGIKLENFAPTPAPAVEPEETDTTEHTTEPEETTGTGHNNGCRFVLQQPTDRFFLSDTAAATGYTNTESKSCTGKYGILPDSESATNATKCLR